MHWETHYKKNTMTVEAAIQMIDSNSRIMIAHSAGEPTILVDELINQYERLENVEIFQLLNLRDAKFADEQYKGHFKFSGVFLSGGTRRAIEGGYGDFTPCFFHELPDHLKNIGLDTALVQVTPPDEYGFCSLGTSIDYVKPGAQVSKKIIAQVNQQLPRTLGDTFLHVSEIDAFVEGNCDILELGIPAISEIEMKIGEYCASLVKDGDVLQLGIGSIPDAVVAFLKDKKHLGIHSEMISDGVVDLILSGAVDNSTKKINQGKSIVTFLMGTKKLYDFAHNNAHLEMYPVDYTNHPAVVMQNDNVVSINSCIEVDLQGQVVSESIGLRQYSGVGGQVDFIRGASMSKGGRSILVMPSTAGGGKFSRIVPLLKEGAAVTTSRNDVDFIVTEYGIAKLKGKSLRERAKALIEISHPDFKDALKVAFDERFKGC